MAYVSRNVTGCGRECYGWLARVDGGSPGVRVIHTVARGMHQSESEVLFDGFAFAFPYLFSP